MNKNKLSSEDDWKKYWEGKKNPDIITPTYSYYDFIKLAVGDVKKNSTSVELGGFPGKFSIFLKKYCGFNTTLVDYYIDRSVIEQLFEFNGLSCMDIECIQEDILLSKPGKQYDLVCSFGLIEHFVDLTEILCAHIKYMKPGATLVISMPNFRGLNGLLQKLFDPETLALHNLKVMDINLLKATLTNLKLEDIDVIYYPSTQVWIENLKERGIFLNILIRVINKIIPLIGMVFGRNNQLLSNSIILMARSNSNML